MLINVGKHKSSINWYFYSFRLKWKDTTLQINIKCVAFMTRQRISLKSCQMSYKLKACFLCQYIHFSDHWKVMYILTSFLSQWLMMVELATNSYFKTITLINFNQGWSNYIGFIFFIFKNIFPYFTIKIQFSLLFSSSPPHFVLSFPIYNSTVFVKKSEGLPMDITKA